MSNSGQSSGGFVDAFFKLFSSDKSSQSASQSNRKSSNFDREWKRQNNEPVPGTVKQVRSGADIPVILSSTSRSDHLSLSLPDLPAYNPNEGVPQSSSSSNVNSKNHSDLSRSLSGMGMGSRASIGSSTLSHSSDVPFVVVDPKIKKYKTLLSQENVDIEALGKLCWNGVPDEFRAQVWRLLLGYSPPNQQRRDSVLSRKREEYKDLCMRYYCDLSTNELKPEWLKTISSQEAALLHQIKIDVPRTLPHNPLFAVPEIQKCLERILVMWSLRHPASGYVQGINDLVTPFLVVFLKEVLSQKAALTPTFEAENTPIDQQKDEMKQEFSNTTQNDDSSESSCDEPPPSESNPKKFVRQIEDMNINFSLITTEDLELVEADSYWAVSKFIDCIQDNYTSSQPGIQRSLHRLGELVEKLDPALHLHLEQQGVLFVQFAFRWINCLLMRELPLTLVVRLWDTYISEGDRFPALHTYICASLLIAFSKELRESDFQNVMMFLHHLPTDTWTVETIEPLISRAYMWQTLYGDSRHLSGSQAI